MIGWLLDKMGVKSYIKGGQRRFSKLSDNELADMIEAFLNNGSDRFEENALTEFVLLRYRNARLEAVRVRIDAIQESCRTSDQPNGLRSASGIKKLRSLQSELRATSA